MAMMPAIGAVANRTGRAVEAFDGRQRACIFLVRCKNTDHDLGISAMPGGQPNIITQIGKVIDCLRDQGQIAIALVDAVSV